MMVVSMGDSLWRFLLMRPEWMLFDGEDEN